MSETFDAIAIPMLIAQSADESTSHACPIGNTKQHSHFVTFTGAASGVVTIESGPSSDYAGTWEELEVCDAATKLYWEISLPGPGQFVRHRISTVLNAGSVSSSVRRLMRF